MNKKNLLVVTRSPAYPGKAMRTVTDYFMADKTLIQRTSDQSIVGWFSDPQLAKDLVDAYNEKLLNEKDSW